MSITSEVPGNHQEGSQDGAETIDLTDRGGRANNSQLGQERTRRSAFSGPVVVLCHLEGSSLESLELEEPELEVSLDGPQWVWSLALKSQRCGHPTWPILRLPKPSPVWLNLIKAAIKKDREVQDNVAELPASECNFDTRCKIPSVTEPLLFYLHRIDPRDASNVTKQHVLDAIDVYNAKVATQKNIEASEKKLNLKEQILFSFARFDFEVHTSKDKQDARALWNDLRERVPLVKVVKRGVGQGSF
ncbi:hypothetical protein DFH94DRAFT_683523 [Russula ochroleuca]|uniref:Uncharacterized protein n=1 Tax=Russula ochroleuca TaxID=152965 RepID=A0A9P5T6C8_9AGAM|nr:hypothetical protein DFH94DRAFT_683523 [Russula ochroleuca]